MGGRERSEIRKNVEENDRGMGNLEETARKGTSGRYAE